MGIGVAARATGRACRELYLFEWLALTSLILLIVFFSTQPVETQVLRLVLLTMRKMAILAALSVAIMGGMAISPLLRGRARRADRSSETEVAGLALWLDLVRIIVSFSVVQTTHLVLKVYVPLINPQNHDPLLARLDRLLLLGHDPVGLVGRLFSAPGVLGAVDLVYSGLYFFLLWGGVLVFMTLLEGRLRIAFFSSFLLMWQIGLLLYVMLPSWGPVFVSPETFRSSLEHMPLTVAVQTGLHTETAAMVAGRFDGVIRFFGLAAFPSLHVAVFFLYCLWSCKLHRFWLWWNGSWCVLILIGSMLTGYHYLVDGLAGVLVAAFAFVVGQRAELPSRSADE